MGNKLKRRIRSLIGQLLLMNTPSGSRSKCQDLQLITASISIYSSHKLIVWFQKIRNIGQESCAVAPTAVRLDTLKHELRLTWEMFPQQIFQQLIYMSRITEANYFFSGSELDKQVCKMVWINLYLFGLRSQWIIWSGFSVRKKNTVSRTWSRSSPTNNVNKRLLCER